MFSLRLRYLKSTTSRRNKEILCFARCRNYATVQPPKVSLKLVAELRKLTDAPVSTAREALIVANNDFDAAVAWLNQHLAVSGAKKAAKIGDRATKEGLIGISVLSPGYGDSAKTARAAIVELNCETDFVGRNELFSSLASDIAHTTAFLGDMPTDLPENPTLLRTCAVNDLLDAPYVPRNMDIMQAKEIEPGTSVGTVIRNAIAKLGENITLRRAARIVVPMADTGNAGIRVGSYMHGSISRPNGTPGSSSTSAPNGGISDVGRSGALALIYLGSPYLHQRFADPAFLSSYKALERALLRQIVGFDTQTLRTIRPGLGPDTALYEQPFALFPGEFSGMPVKTVLDAWAQKNDLMDGKSKSARATSEVEDEESAFNGIAVNEFARWSVGQNLLEDGSSIATLFSEVMEQVSKSQS